MSRASNQYKLIEQKEWTVKGVQIRFNHLSFEGQSKFSGSSNEDVIRLHFGIKGDYQFYYEELDKSFDLIGGHHNIMYSNPFNIRGFGRTPEISTFGIKFPRHQFRNLLDEDDPLFVEFMDQLDNESPVLLSKHWGSIDSKIQKVIDEIIHNPYDRQLEKIFLYSKSLELLVLCMANYHQRNNTPIVLRHKKDKECIIAARDFINNRLMDPPSISDVAHEVGLNEYKLKKGFKAIFHQSVFSYLTERRINLAYQYLVDTQKPISDIAYELGYASPQHFSAVIKNKFGRSPKYIRNNPKSISVEPKESSYL